MRGWIEAIKLNSAVHTTATGQTRHGIVTSVDAVNHAVKVTIEPEGVETGWIPDGVIAAAGLRIACPSEVGTQVLLVAVEGDAEHPIVVARIFDTVMVPPNSPATSQPVQPGELGVFLASGVYMHLMQSGIVLGGSVTINGQLTVTGDVVADGISVQQHVHSEVRAGQDVSGPPRS